jgi:hypothetical protein
MQTVWSTQCSAPKCQLRTYYDRSVVADTVVISTADLLPLYLKVITDSRCIANFAGHQARWHELTTL